MVRDGKVLVASNYVIDVCAYGSGYTDWNSSSLRTWLNGTFLSTTFSAEEQAKFGKPSGASYGTDDKVFCLSESEANALLTETSGGYGETHKMAQSTGYASKMFSDAGTAGYMNSYWLRSSESTSYPPAIDRDGNIVTSIASSKAIGIRPCMWYDPS